MVIAWSFRLWRYKGESVAPRASLELHARSCFALEMLMEHRQHRNRGHITALLLLRTLDASCLVCRSTAGLGRRLWLRLLCRLLRLLLHCRPRRRSVVVAAQVVHPRLQLVDDAQGQV